MSESHQFIKFMVDIIDSGAWAGLSAGARTLYPVLLKFSDQNFKHVWPSTSTLMELTGFKSKKSIIEAKKDLVNSGLIQVKSGSGHTNSRYYFSFNYPESKIAPRWYPNLHPSGSEKHTSKVDSTALKGGTETNPNQINITITNNQNNKKDKLEGRKNKDSSQSLQDIIDDYGIDIFNESYEIAKSKNLDTQLGYIRAICREKVKQRNVLNNNHSDVRLNPSSPWESFLTWSSLHLTSSTYNSILEISPVFDGKTILLEEPSTTFLKQVIVKFFQDKFPGDVYVLFSEIGKNLSRI